MTNWLVKKGGCDVRDIIREEVGYIDVWRQKRVGYAENLKTTRNKCKQSLANNL